MLRNVDLWDKKKSAEAIVVVAVVVVDCVFVLLSTIPLSHQLSFTQT